MNDEIKVGSRWLARAGNIEVTVEDVGSGAVEFRPEGARSTDPVSEATFRREFIPLDAPSPSPTPAHYAGKIQPRDAIREWGLGFNLGNVIKYVARADRKGTPLDDLEKARECIVHEIAVRKGAVK